MRKNIRYTFLLVMMIAVLFVGTGCDLFIKTSDAKVDLNWYMGLTYEDSNGDDKAFTTSYGDDIAAVALEDKYSEEYAIVKSGEAYVNIDTIKENIDDRFYWDKNENLLLFTNATTVYRTNVGENVISGDGNETVDYVISVAENSKCYVNMKFVEKFVDLDYKLYKKSGKNPARVSICYLNGKKTIMSTTKEIEMRTKGNYQNMIVATLDKKTKVTLLEKGENWNKVRTEDGYIGYVPVKKLDDAGTQTAKYKDDKVEYTHVSTGKKVSLAWNQVYNQTANDNLEKLTKKMSGVNVISPTWFSITDKKGNLSTLADLDYVEKAHKKGLQVWPLVNDFKSKKLTKQVIESTKVRQQLVKNIMYFINSYDLDGINIDFEYINVDEADSYLQFLRELSVECRKAKKVLSIDNYVPSEWTEFYDRNQQYLLADYLIIMNYDEHTSGSKEAGSVSSMGYAEKAIKETIEQTGDASRVINGMPFYTRLWYLTPATEGESQEDSGVFVEDAANGNYYLSSQALGMEAAKKEYNKAGVKPTFDENTGQNYVTYALVLGDAMMWLEDKTSVKSRLDLMEKYELGGAAYWSLGQETDDIWEVISEYFK